MAIIDTDMIPNDLKMYILKKYLYMHIATNIQRPEVKNVFGYILNRVKVFKMCI